MLPGSGEGPEDGLPVGMLPKRRMDTGGRSSLQQIKMKKIENVNKAHCSVRRIWLPGSGESPEEGLPVGMLPKRRMDTGGRSLRSTNKLGTKS